MNPKARICFFFFLVCIPFIGVALIYCGATSSFLHPYTVNLWTAMGIFILITIPIVEVTTAFTRLPLLESAKEVWLMFNWQRITGRPINEYPSTLESRQATRPILYELFVGLLRKWIAAKQKVDGYRAKGYILKHGIEVADEYLLEFEISKYWLFLKRLGLLPIHPISQRSWSNVDVKVFQNFVYKHPEYLDVLLLAKQRHDNLLTISV